MPEARSGYLPHQLTDAIKSAGRLYMFLDRLLGKMEMIIEVSDFIWSLQQVKIKERMPHCS